MINVCVKFGVTIFISTGFASIPFGGIEWYLCASICTDSTAFICVVVVACFAYFRFAVSTSLVSFLSSTSNIISLWILNGYSFFWLLPLVLLLLLLSRDTDVVQFVCGPIFSQFFSISLGYTYSVYLFLVIGWFLWCHLVHLDGVVDVLIVDALHRQTERIKYNANGIFSWQKYYQRYNKTITLTKCKWQFFFGSFFSSSGVCTLYWCSISA